jgi:hypothetical protein
MLLFLETLSAAPDIPTSHVVRRFFAAAPSCVASDKIYKKAGGITPKVPE